MARCSDRECDRCVWGSASLASGKQDRRALSTQQVHAAVREPKRARGKLPRTCPAHAMGCALFPVACQGKVLADISTLSVPAWLLYLIHK